MDQMMQKMHPLFSPVLASLQDVQLQHVDVSQQGVFCSARSRGVADLN